MLFSKKSVFVIKVGNNLKPMVKYFTEACETCARYIEIRTFIFVDKKIK